MDPSTEDRLKQIEAGLAALLAIVKPMADAWERFGPMLEKRLDNPAAKWKARRNA
jgi:hypothetical protein